MFLPLGKIFGCSMGKRTDSFDYARACVCLSFEQNIRHNQLPYRGKLNTNTFLNRNCLISMCSLHLSIEEMPLPLIFCFFHSISHCWFKYLPSSLQVCYTGPKLVYMCPLVVTCSSLVPPLLPSGMLSWFRFCNISDDSNFKASEYICHTCPVSPYLKLTSTHTFLLVATSFIGAFVGCMGVSGCVSKVSKNINMYSLLTNL